MSLTTLCSYPGCARKIAIGSGRCAQHAATRSTSGSRHPIYTSKEWKDLRAQIIARDPICKICHKKESRIADHITPISKGGDMWNPTNLQGICWPCHSRKTAREDGGFGNNRKAPIFTGVGPTVGDIRLRDEVVGGSKSLPKSSILACAPINFYDNEIGVDKKKARGGR